MLGTFAWDVTTTPDYLRHAGHRYGRARRCSARCGMCDASLIWDHGLQVFACLADPDEQIAPEDVLIEWDQIAHRSGMGRLIVATYEPLDID